MWHMMQPVSTSQAHTVSPVEGVSVKNVEKNRTQVPHSPPKCLAAWESAKAVMIKCLLIYCFQFLYLHAQWLSVGGLGWDTTRPAQFGMEAETLEWWLGLPGNLVCVYDKCCNI